MEQSQESTLTDTNIETTTLGAGCFWGVEDAFAKLAGVVRTTVGYSGGSTPEPSYQQVCSNTTGHAEVVEIEFDPTIVNYETILETFWKCHDPTQVNRQGVDVGSQYRSVIFVHNNEQRVIAERSKEQAQKNFRKPIATAIEPAKDFYRAEEYHQKYLEKNR